MPSEPTQDFYCPFCRHFTKASEVEVRRIKDYFYPADKVAVLARSGYHWIKPYPHLYGGEPCDGEDSIFYVGDANLATP